MKQLIVIALVFLAQSGEVSAQLTNSGNIRTFTGANITIYGDVTNNGTITDSGTLITLAGPGLQTIDGNVVTTLNNLRLNNSSADGITLAQALNVGGTLTFTDGYMNTTAANILTLTATSAVTGAGSNSFVSGPVSKTGNTALIFPVGKDAIYAPIAISAPAAGTDGFTAEYFQVSPNASYNIASLESGLHHVSDCEYWMLDRTSGSSNVAVTLDWDTRSCGLSTPDNLRVAQWDGIQWTDEGNGGTTGTIVAGTIVSGGAVTDFGPFTLASSTSTNALPVELLGFIAQCQDEQSVLRWSTASELQNDFFTIESSSDGFDWEPLADVEGAGTTTMLTNYAWTDLSNPGWDRYYRLSQTNTDGEMTVQGIVYLESCRSFKEDAIIVYPNPAKSVVNILTEENVTAITVSNPEGKMLSNIPVDLQYKQIDFREMPGGIYLMRITTEWGIFYEKVIISRN